jgi:predicted metal-dependent phosphoesterase TrpH
MNYRTPFLTTFLALSTTQSFAGDGPGKLPDIQGFHTLHCDFHIHTVFSDGKVWPDMRVLEAAREGLDCIAITDHFKYQLESVRKKHPEIQGDRNRAYEIAHDAAQGSDVIVIRGAEVTQGMPPGHINAIFLEDAEIARPDLVDTMKIAPDQGAFLFWNLPGWKSPDKKL